MPIYNPTIYIVPDGTFMQHPQTGFRCVVTDKKSMFIGTDIYCTEPSFQGMLQNVNEKHPDFVKISKSSHN